jgi:poly(3-hydroxybutyrate) depolymerase
VAYLAVVIRTPRERKIRLSSGSDEGIEVWLNGRRILKRFLKRSATRDNDLVGLDLVSGENLLVLKLCRSDKGPWRVFARLMDESFEAPEDIDIVLPGALKDFHSAFERRGRLELERKLDLAGRAMDLKVWLAFPGGRPITGETKFKTSFVGSGRPEAQEGAIDLSSAGPEDIGLGAFRFEGDKAPSAVRVEIGDSEIKVSLGFRMQDVAGLADAFADLKASEKNVEIPRTSRESAAWRVEHLKALIENGDTDYRYLSREIKDTKAIAKALASGQDPYWDRRGEVQRRGYRSKLDGSYQHYALYVPPDWREDGDKSFGLVVSLHGLNGSPMNNMMAVFGENRDESETKIARERNPDRVGPAPFFVLSPYGFGNSGWRAFGEIDVIETIDRVRERYRIDPDRIYITGLSMGGIGSASIPLHKPDLFAAAAPLCGYHSLFLYRSLKTAKLKPWERFMAGFRSNKDWALNGRYLPLYVVHGLKDTPRNSDVLVDRYKEMGYDVKYETPNLGHHVWDQTYEKHRIFTHFAGYRRVAHPQRVTFTTSRLRYRSSRWIRIDDAFDYAKWSSVEADWGENN